MKGYLWNYNKNKINIVKNSEVDCGMESCRRLLVVMWELGMKGGVRFRLRMGILRVIVIF